MKKTAWGPSETLSNGPPGKGLGLKLEELGSEAPDSWKPWKNGLGMWAGSPGEALPTMTADSRFLDMTIKNWIAQMSPQERNVLVDALFGLLESGEVTNAMDIFHPKNIRHYLKALRANGNIRKLFTNELRSLAAAAKTARERFSITEE